MGTMGYGIIVRIIKKPKTAIQMGEPVFVTAWGEEVWFDVDNIKIGKIYFLEFTDEKLMGIQVGKVKKVTNIEKLLKIETEDNIYFIRKTI